MGRPAKYKTVEQRRAARACKQKRWRVHKHSGKVERDRLLRRWAAEEQYYRECAEQVTEPIDVEPMDLEESETASATAVSGTS